MNALVFIVVVFIVGMAAMFIEMLRVPAGIEREHHIEQGKIYSRTSTVTEAPIDEVVRLLQGHWSWWKRARAEKMRDLGDGRKEFVFHPVRYFDFIEVPPAFLVRFERTEKLPDGGVRIYASLVGDFDGKAEYTVRPSTGGTLVELAWCGAEVKSILRFAPIALVAAIHCWRERLGVEGLRALLKSRQSGT